ncbi:MAG: toxin-antitoxin system [Actinomycetota bacterium]|nr:toxin-antitoxin system [Actinomycetota bacterium]
MTGRPSKGERHVVVTRPHRVVADSLMAHAKEQGVSISDYVADVLARHEGLDHLAPTPPKTKQPKLPLKG